MSSPSVETRVSSKAGWLKKNASGVLKTIGSALSGLGTFAVAGAAAVAGAGIGIGAAITKLAIDAAPVEGIRGAFEGLTESMGVGADEMMAALQQGSSGMIAQRDLMASFNQSAQLISEDFASTLPDAMQYMAKISAATGEDIEEPEKSMVMPR